MTTPTPPTEKCECPEPNPYPWEKPVCSRCGLPTHTTDTGWERYAVESKLLDRFFELYKAGREDGVEVNLIDYFAARHFLLDEVEKAIQHIAKEEYERGRSSVIKKLDPRRKGNTKPYTEGENALARENKAGWNACSEYLRKAALETPS